jgi:NADPH2:quinone reductase
VVGSSEDTPNATTFDVSSFYPRGGARLRGLSVFDELRRHSFGGRGLSLLVAELAAGRLDPQIDLTASWREADTALTALMERRVAGKAVLTID